MLLRAIVFPSYVTSINKWLIRLVPMQAFPAGSGPRDRTTYMFTYLDATPNRPSLEQMLEDYWDLMPPYQVSLSLSFSLSLPSCSPLTMTYTIGTNKGVGIF